ncbi:MAG TPA: orotidine-5'-phosphate decarboxylase, partial [Polyangiales bacterium]|nr:orotidine-5'-phosphate decarboxylase [Polyangiales bacterium]
TLDGAVELIDLLHAEVGVFKVGLELFSSVGPDAVRAVHARGRRTFLDLKLHDIPATVQGAVEAALRLDCAFLTVHAAAGPETLRAAARVAAGTDLELLAVTVLTSFDDGALATIGMQGPIPQAVMRMAKLAVACGVRGLVCAPSECAALRAEFGSEVLLVTPGIRPAGSSKDDQRRVATPTAALEAGADLVVVGRPIRDAAEPRAAAESVVQEIARALS